MSQSLDSMLSARRADLVPTEVIAPEAAGDSPPDGGSPPPPAGPLIPAGTPAPEPDALAQFPLIPPKVLGGLPYASNYMKLAKTIHQTELVPKAFKGRPDAIMAAMMYGYELGLGPMQALNGLHVIEGKVGQDAELMRALITEQGHLFVLQSGVDDAGEPWATVYCRRKDWPADLPTGEFTWTLQDGRKAGLVEWYEKWTKTERGGNRKLTWNPHGNEGEPDWVSSSGATLKLASSWANYGEDMCIARATARAARANFADVLKGMSYTPEELAEFDGGNGTAPQEEVTPSPAPESPTPLATAPDSPEAASGTPATPATDQMDPSPQDSLPSGALPTSGTSPSPSVPPAKKAAKASKAAKKVAATPPVSEQTADVEGSVDSTPDDTATPPSPPEQTALVPTEAGDGSPTTLADAAATSSVSEQPAFNLELVRSLGGILEQMPQAQANLCRAFLSQHFPGRGAKELTDAELTKAINIAGGWPESADQYPPPVFDGDGVEF